MNAYAMFAADEALRVANQRLAELRQESRNSRLGIADRPRRSARKAVALLISSISGAIAAADEMKPAVPRLADYPYRS